ncbi:MAG TPA: hypothetical protein VK835_11895 [Bacteroidia bacterium]|nr:hypothetical protein [Bacteroidia bacterium]
MIKKALFIVILFTLLGGCSNSLSLLAPYKEIVSVYGLLNQDDPVQYIRIERVFLGAQDAHVMAQNQDSVYFKSGDIKVTLQRWINGVQVSVDNPSSSAMEIVLTDTLIQAATGVFNQNERVYKTNHKIYSDSQYNLTIHNNKSGKEFTAQTGLIQNFAGQLLPSTPGYPNILVNHYNLNTKINIVPNAGLDYCYYNSPVNAGVCGLVLRFFYTEYNGGASTKESLDIDLGTNYPIQTVGGEKQEFDFAGRLVLINMANLIPVNQSVTRTVDSAEFILTAAGQALALYNQVNMSTSLSQNKANYSNINGGIGVFSCRNELKLLRSINSTTCVDTISGNSLTCKLRFLNSGGGLSICH